MSNDTPPLQPIYFGSNPPWFSAGVDVNSNRPVLIDVALFSEHCHLLGKTGSHKTLFSVQLVCFLIENTDSAVVYVDYGKDRYAFNRIRQSAVTANRRFRFFSLSPKHQSDSFDPLKAYTPLETDNADRVTDYLVSALSLDPGLGDKAYFGKVNWSTISLATQALIEAGITHPTLLDYRNRLEYFSQLVRRNDVAESLLAFQQLASVPCLRSPLNPAREIDYQRVLEDREVVFLYLPTLLSPASRAIGGLNLFSIAGAAMARDDDEDLPERKAFIAIDEFQQIANDSKAFMDFETLTRKFGIGLSPMANQSFSQLQGRSTDLRDVIFDNTNVKFYLTSNDDYVVDKIRTRSKDVVKELTGRSSSGDFGLNLGSQTRPYIDREFERNQCINASARRFHGVLMVDDGIAQHEPIHLRFDPGCTKAEYNKIRKIPIPARLPSGNEITAPSTPLDAPRRVERHKLLQSIMNRIQSQESYPPSVSE